MAKGGKREGAGRPLGAEELRKMRCLRASSQEWEVIQRFVKMLKYGDKVKARQFVEENCP